VRDAGEIERAVAAFARAPNGGLIVTASAAATLHRDLIITLAARHKLPAVYSERSFVAAGGLISYGLTTSTNTGRRRLCRSHPQGEKPPTSGAGADQIRDVLNLRPPRRSASMCRRSCSPARRGDRIALSFAAVHESLHDINANWL